MKLQARNFVVRKPETIDITMFFKKFCIATRTKNKAICQRQMALFLGSAPCGRSTPRGSNMPGASELPLRQDFAAQNTCDGAPAPPRRVGAWFGRRPY